VGGVIMPNAHFYIRNHFRTPVLDPGDFRLAVTGLVERPLSLGLRELYAMPSHTMVATLECAGNGRTHFQPPIPGETWNLGAVSTAEWTGVPLVAVLDRAGVRTGALEALFRGADGGQVEDRVGAIRFERSLSLDLARDPDVLVAYAMNGEALPVQHGFPVRLIVPGWYAMASVKWLTGIELIDRPFAGYYQTDRYCYEWTREGAPDREPVTLQRVRALITEPLPDQQRPSGDLAIRGVAWSGAAAIACVEISVNGGNWRQARLVSAPAPYAWQRWELITRVETPGMTTVRARATDRAGHTQPDHAEWNRLGYGNNAVQEVAVRIA
jgi:DMSO/TMAO reductase YedYZ molybdopterin-dependent catalytic subunit